MRRASSLTFRLELISGIFEGVLQIGWQSISLVILIEAFLKPEGQSGELLQGIVFASSFLGMIFSIYYNGMLQASNLRKSTGVAIPSALAGVAFLGAMFANNTLSYVFLVSVAHFLLPLKIPILTQIFHDNYEQGTLGKKRSYSLLIVQATSIVGSYIAGEWIEAHPQRWEYVFALFGIVSIASTWVYYNYPSLKFKKTPYKGLLETLQWLKKDKSFAYLLGVWFLFGIANLAILPIRVTHLSNFKWLSPSKVVLLSAVIPETMRMFSLPIWARLFDRMNFIALRILLNSFFAVGIFVFFLADSFYGFVFGSILHGIGFGGGRLAWGLWVTKMIPKERTGDYMSIHVAATGIRGVIGPILAYWLVSDNGIFQLKISTLGIGSSIIFLLSIVLLLPLIKEGKVS